MRWLSSVSAQQLFLAGSVSTAAASIHAAANSRHVRPRAVIQGHRATGLGEAPSDPQTHDPGTDDDGLG